jgi:GMP synthase-like glutamine amidotransferase
MRVHGLQHVPFEGLGRIAPWLEARGARIATSRLFEDPMLPGVDELDWLVVMGGPMSVNDEAAHPWLAAEKRLIAEAVAASKVVLGVCLGAQLIASALGARVFDHREREIGWFPVTPTEAASRSPFARLFAAPFTPLHWHGQTFELPPGAVHLARSAGCEHQAFGLGGRVLALQFHLELEPESVRALAHACPGDLAPGRWIQSEAEMLRAPERFHAAHRSLDAVLDHLAARAAT